MKILLPPLKNYFQELALETQEEFLIISPWIKMDALDIIISQVKNKNISKLITLGNFEDFLCGASDIEVFEYLFSNNCTISLIQNLHAKIYISDRKKAIVTSENCTFSGLTRNAEIGVLIDEPEKVEELNETFHAWHKQGRIIDREWIDKIREEILGKSLLLKKIEESKKKLFIVDDTLKGKRIKFRRSKPPFKNQVNDSLKKSDWRTAIRGWQSAIKNPEFLEDIITFFEIAFRKLPEEYREKSRFGVQKGTISFTIGHILIQSVKDNQKAEIITDKEKDVRFNSIKKNSIGLKYYSWSELSEINNNKKVWDSFISALGKIWESHHSRLYRADHEKVRICITNFFDDSTGELI